MRRWRRRLALPTPRSDRSNLSCIDDPQRSFAYFIFGCFSLTVFFLFIFFSFIHASQTGCTCGTGREAPTRSGEGKERGRTTKRCDERGKMPGRVLLAFFPTLPVVWTKGPSFARVVCRRRWTALFTRHWDWNCRLPIAPCVTTKTGRSPTSSVTFLATPCHWKSTNRRQ
jgi:hypothetical protein